MIVPLTNLPVRDLLVIQVLRMMQNHQTDFNALSIYQGICTMCVQDLIDQLIPEVDTAFILWQIQMWHVADSM